MPMINAVADWFDRRLQLGAPLRILLGQLFAPLVLFDRALLRH